jgi:hypothetical protein
MGAVADVDEECGMNLGELISTAKELADDNRASGLWTSAALKIYANEAESEAARRSRLLVDIVTEKDAYDTPVCTHPVLKGAYSITLHPKTLFVRRVKVASQPLPLPAVHIRDLDRLAPEWDQHAEGSVVAFCPNWQPKKILFYNAFEAADTVKLQIVRLPLVPMIGPDDSPEIDESYHMGLINWMLFRAFTKPDPDTKDKVKAKDYLDLFEQQFGKRSSAIDETWIQREHGYDEFEGLF